jgi:hypothetical protein
MNSKCRKKQTPWTSEQRDYLEQALKHGRGVQEVANALGRSYGSVWHMARRIGLVTPSKRNPAGANKGKICNETCPDYCPYKDCKLAAHHIKDSVSEYIDRADRGRICEKQSAKVMLDGSVRRMFGV